MKSLPLFNKSMLSQVSGLRGQTFGAQGQLQVNIKRQSGSPSVNVSSDRATISAAGSAQLQGAATPTGPESAERQELYSKDDASRRQRGEELRGRLLDRARAGGIGIKAVASAMSRLDARFDLDSTAFVEDYSKEFESLRASQSVEVKEPAQPDRMVKMQGKLKAMAHEFDMRAKESGVSAERVAHLKALLHERARAAYAQGQESAT